MSPEQFRRDGYGITRAGFSAAQVKEMIEMLPTLDGAAGSRNLLTQPYFRELARDRRLLDLVKSCLGAEARAVRGILFDKALDTNWALGWHQDNKIAVTARHDVPGYKSWSVKEGIPHCKPPLRVLESMVALRIALDKNDLTNGPLLVIPGSNRYSFLTREQANELAKGDQVTCLAESGDVVIMSSLTLHASGKVTEPRHRRVIQLEYAAANLDPPITWVFAPAFSG